MKTSYFLLLSASLFLFNCSSSTDSGDTDNNPTSQPPTAIDIQNIEQGETLNGKVSVVIDDDSDMSPSNLVISLNGEELVNEVSPSLPYEIEIETYKYNNDSYDIAVQAEYPEAELTLNKEIGVSFENYLLQIEYGGQLEIIAQSRDEVEVVISDLEGRILSGKNLEFTSTGSTIKLGSPNEIASLPTSSIIMTIKSLFVGTSSTYGTTHSHFLYSFMFEPWGDVISLAPYEKSNSSFTLIENYLSITNFTDYNKYDLIAPIANSETYPIPMSLGQDDIIEATFNHFDGLSNVAFTLVPKNEFNDLNPLYVYLTDTYLTSNDSIKIDFQDFKPFERTQIESNNNEGLSSSVRHYTSKNERNFSFGSFPLENNFLIYPPIESEIYRTHINRSENEGNGIAVYYQIYVGGIPNNYEEISIGANTDIHLDNNTNEISVFGEDKFDVAEINLRYQNNRNSISWNIHIPDSMSAVILPDFIELRDMPMNISYLAYREYSNFDDYRSRILSLLSIGNPFVSEHYHWGKVINKSSSNKLPTKLEATFNNKY